MKIPEPKGEGEARPWTTGTKKARWKRLPSVGLAPRPREHRAKLRRLSWACSFSSGKVKAPGGHAAAPVLRGVSREFQLVAPHRNHWGNLWSWATEYPPQNGEARDLPHPAFRSETALLLPAATKRRSQRVAQDICRAVAVDQSGQGTWWAVPPGSGHQPLNCACTESVLLPVWASHQI